MCGLRTRPRTDVDPPRFLPQSNCRRRAAYRLAAPRGDTLFLALFRLLGRMLQVTHLVAAPAVNTRPAYVVGRSVRWPICWFSVRRSRWIALALCMRQIRPFVRINDTSCVCHSASSLSASSALICRPCTVTSISPVDMTRGSHPLSHRHTKHDTIRYEMLV